MKQALLLLLGLGIGIVAGRFALPQEAEAATVPGPAAEGVPGADVDRASRSTGTAVAFDSPEDGREPQALRSAATPDDLLAALELNFTLGVEAIRTVVCNESVTAEALRTDPRFDSFRDNEAFHGAVYGSSRSVDAQLIGWGFVGLRESAWAQLLSSKVAAIESSKPVGYDVLRVPDKGSEAYAQAREEALAAWRLWPASPDGKFYVAAAFLREGDSKEALRLLEAVESQSEWKSSVLAGPAYTATLRSLALQQQGNPEQAKGELRRAAGEMDGSVAADLRDWFAEAVQAVGIDPVAARELTTAGESKLIEGDRAGAAQAFEQAIQTDDGMATAHYGLSQVHALGGEAEPCVKCLSRAIELDGKLSAAARSAAEFDGVRASSEFVELVYSDLMSPSEVQKKLNGSPSRSARIARAPQTSGSFGFTTSAGGGSEDQVKVYTENDEVWDIVKFSGQSKEQYEAALDRGVRAWRSWPTYTHLIHTLAFARYRVGDPQGSLDLLALVEEINPRLPANERGSGPWYTVLKAMAHKGLGQDELAARFLAQARQEAKKVDSSDLAQVLREAEKKVGS